MSLLIIGGDRINPIIDVLGECGVDDIIHWTARNQKNGRKQARKIPDKVDIVLMLTNFLNHNSMRYYRAEAKSKGLPIVYSTRHIDCVKNEFMKVIANLDDNSQICKTCKEYQKCYEE